MLRLLAAMVMLMAIAGCERGPDADAVRRDVEARVAAALPAGTVGIASLQRRGSQADNRVRGETRRVVYFDVNLNVERDVDFGAWDAPGIAGLVSALGAGPKGIVGIRSGGNKAGDRVTAHGTVVYRRDGEHWAAVAPGGYRPSEAPSYATNAPRAGPEALLEAMRTVIASVTKDASPAHMLVIEEELQAAHATIRARLARVGSGYAIAAGPEHGQYLRYAQALAQTDPKVRIDALVTLGGEENLTLLRAGKVSLALAQGDAAQDAYEGTGRFRAYGPDTGLRALGSLYPEPVHVIVRADAQLSSVQELRGRAVAIGRPGSASRTTALEVLEAHGLRLADVRPVELPLADALRALRRNDVDAVIQIIGVPADSIRDAIAALPLRLLPLAPEAVKSLVEARSGLFAHTVAAGAYASQTTPVATVATAALLLAGPELSDAEVGGLTRLVYGRERDLAARGSAQGQQVSAATARQGLTVPMHDAAAKAMAALAGTPMAAPSAAAAASR